MASSLLNPLRPKPFRGDVIAAGVVVLATLVWVVRWRFTDVWGPGVLFAFPGVVWAFVTTLAVLAPMESDDPRAYQSVLYVTSLAVATAALDALAEVLGTGGTLSGPGNVTWFLAALAVFALAFAMGRNSAVCTLLGALAAGGAIVAAVQWLWNPDGFATFRWVLLGLTVVYTLAAIGQRDRRLRHGVALIDAAGLAVLAIALSFIFHGWILDIAGSSGSAFARIGWGWELVIVAGGFGLIAYSSVDRQPGPAYLGVANLAAFGLITALGVTREDASLVGWPIALAVVAAILLAIGLRPSTPAPPPPDIDAPEPPPLPLR